MTPRPIQDRAGALPGFVSPVGDFGRIALFFRFATPTFTGWASFTVPVAVRMNVGLDTEW